MGTELRFGGHRNSTLHTRLCNVENGNSLCISGYLTRAFRRNSGQNLRKKIDQQTFAESSSSAALKDVGENQISVQPVSPGLSKAVRRTLPTRVGLTHDAQHSLVLAQGRHGQRNAIGRRDSPHACLACIWRSRADRVCALALRRPEHQSKHAASCAGSVRRCRPDLSLK